MEILPHDRNVYLAEGQAMDRIEPRLLTRHAAVALAEQVTGFLPRLHLIDDPRFSGQATWDNGVARLAFSDYDSITDVLLAHELGHLLADRHSPTGHGKRWLMAYLSALRHFGRRDEATVIRNHLAPVIVKQSLDIPA